MSQITTMDSNTVRNQWRAVLDENAKGVDTIVTRYGKPVSVVISYEDYLAVQEQLEDLRDGRYAEQVLAAIKADPSRVRPLREFLAELDIDPDTLAAKDA
jgi:prevent-host-death family protein